MHGGRVVHPLALLVHGQPQPAAHLLPAGDGAVTVLERADDKHVGVVPAFAQGRVRENEAGGLLKRQQPLLVLQDQVVGGHIVGHAGVLAACLECGIQLTALFVDGKVAVVGSGRFDVLQVTLVRRVVKLQYLVQVLVVLFLENAGVLALFVVCAIVAVLGHLVDEEQRQYLDALLQQPLLLVEVCLDGLANLQAA